MQTLQRAESEITKQSYPVPDRTLQNNPELLIHQRPKYSIQVQKLKWMTFSQYLESIDVGDGLMELAKKKHSKICEFVYFFELTASDPNNPRFTQKWTIRRRFFDFRGLNQKLNHELTHKNTKLLINDIPQLNKFYNNPQKENAEEFLEAAGEFLQALLNYQEARNQSVALYEFIELSLLPLPSSPQRYKEGFMLKRGGGRFNNSKLNFIGDSLLKHWNKRWFVLTEEAIIYTMDCNSSDAREVLLFDQSFKIEYGRQGTGLNKGLAIITPNRILKLRTNHIFEALDWVDTIQKVAKATLYTKPHRYNSFAPIREITNYCKAFVDSKGYFKELYECLIKAKKEVFITDWWLSPEIYLKYPVKEGSLEHRLDKVLGRIAEAGVKVYIVVYHEVKMFMFNDSKHTKKALEMLSPNIRVLQHPHKHFFKWSNHGKMVVIDQCVGFLGGFDLSFGRLDDGAHPLVDPEFQEGKGEERFVGMEYSNVRIANFEKLNHYEYSLIDKATTPRLPWHDGMVKVIGPAVMDMSRHFIQFWNHVTIDVYKKKYEIPTLREHFNNDFYIYNDKENENNNNLNLSEVQLEKKPLGLSDKEPLHLRNMLEKQETLRLYVDFGGEDLQGTCTCQMLRSGCNWSLGLDWRTKKRERSIQEAYLEVIRNAKSFIYIENQFFISSTAGDSIQNTITQAMVDRIVRAHENGERFRIVIFLPLIHAFEGEINTSKAMTIRIQLHWQFRTICRGGNSIYEQLQRKGIKPEEYIQFYSLRQHGKMMTGEPATEIIYIHSKILIADDDTVIIGSANINDRSMTGTHDSEIAMVIEDSKKVDSKMNGKDVKVSKFASNFRRRLLAEHLGLTEKEVEDPLTLEFTTLMNNITEQNTATFREIFACYPDDNLRRLKDVEIFKNQKDLTKYDKLVSRFQGHIVWYPLDFMADESLEAPKRAPEHYVPEKTFV